MKKILLVIFAFLYFGNVIAAGHLSDKDKKATKKNHHKEALDEWAIEYQLAIRNTIKK